jgi:hypothetical protein
VLLAELEGAYLPKAPTPRRRRPSPRPDPASFQFILFYFIFKIGFSFWVILGGDFGGLGDKAFIE